MTRIVVLATCILAVALACNACDKLKSSYLMDVEPNDPHYADYSAAFLQVAPSLKLSDDSTDTVFSELKSLLKKLRGHLASAQALSKSRSEGAASGTSNGAPSEEDAHALAAKVSMLRTLLCLRRGPCPHEHIFNFMIARQLAEYEAPALFNYIEYYESDHFKRLAEWASTNLKGRLEKDHMEIDRIESFFQRVLESPVVRTDEKFLDFLKKFDVAKANWDVKLIERVSIPWGEFSPSAPTHQTAKSGFDLVCSRLIGDFYEELWTVNLYIALSGGADPFMGEPRLQTLNEMNRICLDITKNEPRFSSAIKYNSFKDRLADLLRQVSFNSRDEQPMED